MSTRDGSDTILLLLIKFTIYDKLRFFSMSLYFINPSNSLVPS
jgi:hypothetical protein